ncbi:MAG: acyltransferase [Micrococcales bacterium]|nr:acyltransferase [Micrococcales bacterium]
MSTSAPPRSDQAPPRPSTAPASAKNGPAGGKRSEARTDIQGLRALAVGVVVAFHLWPTSLTGGYVGVDVFFVISGFLITTHLLRKPVRSVRDVAQFWARRIRRLIPAASLVLVVTTVAGFVWLPSTVRGGLGRDGVAAALYVENWSLARSATDYLAADQMPSAMQHYWSLSVEEQFYVVWPVLLGVVTALAALAARRSGRDHRTVAVAVAVAVVVVGSLVWSAHLTRVDPASAYFVSTTRAWELGLGGLLAAVLAVSSGRAVRWPQVRFVRAAAAWAGLALIAVSACWYDAGTPFPGVAALLPTVGTAMVIAAAADEVRGGPGRVLALRPVQWVGDVSYSVYLWHWPLIVIVPFAVGRDLGFFDAVAVLGLTLVLSAFTKRFVEDGLRWHPLLSRRLAATLALGALCMAGVGVLGGSIAWASAATQAHAVDRVRAAVVKPCVGADVVRDKTCADPGLLTPPEFAATDKPVVFADGCWNKVPFTTRHVCTYGVQENPKARIALVGNSHAGHWVPALEDTLDGTGWQLTTYVQSGCYTVDIPIDFNGEGVTENCQAINEWAVDQILASDPDLVIMSDKSHLPLVDVLKEDQVKVAEPAYARTIARFTDAGIPVLVVREVPRMGGNVPDCIAVHRNDLAACAVERATALPPDPLANAAAADQSGLVSVLDLTDFFCDAQTCHAVVGGVIVYFDHSHLSATFARTLAPEMVDAVADALEKP